MGLARDSIGPDAGPYTQSKGYGKQPLLFSLALLPGVLGSMFPGEDVHRGPLEAGQNTYRVFFQFPF